MPAIQVQRLYRNRCGVWCFRLRAGTADSRVSLGTKDALAAHMMAAKINDAIEAARASGMSQKNPKLSDLNIDLAALRRYELDLRNGVAKASDAEDHARMMEAIDRIGMIPGGWPASQPVPQPVPVAPAVLASLPVSKVAEMWLAERKQKNAPRTVYAKECHWKDFARRISGDVEVNAIGKAILVGYKAALLAEGQKAKTIDNKLMTLSDLFEFALSNGHYTAGNANPAAGLFILTRAERQAKAQKYQPFTSGDLAKFFEPDAYKRGMAEPDFYWCPLLAVYSGMRISEATGIHCEDVKTAENGVAYVFVRKSKTGAGVRNVPISQALLDLGFLVFVERQRAAGQCSAVPGPAADTGQLLEGAGHQDEGLPRGAGHQEGRGQSGEEELPQLPGERHHGVGERWGEHGSGDADRWAQGQRGR